MLKRCSWAGGGTVKPGFRRSRVKGTTAADNAVPDVSEDQGGALLLWPFGRPPLALVLTGELWTLVSNLVLPAQQILKPWHSPFRCSACCLKLLGAVGTVVSSSVASLTVFLLCNSQINMEARCLEFWRLPSHAASICSKPTGNLANSESREKHSHGVDNTSYN